MFIYSFVYLFVYLFICLFIYLFIHLFIYSFVYLFICLFIYLFVYLFICLFIYLFIYFLSLIMTGTAFALLSIAASIGKVLSPILLNAVYAKAVLLNFPELTFYLAAAIYALPITLTA